MFMKWVDAKLWGVVFMTLIRISNRLAVRSQFILIDMSFEQQELLFEGRNMLMKWVDPPPPNWGGGGR